MSQVAHQAGAYPGSGSMKRLVVFLLLRSLDGMLVYHRVTPSSEFSVTYVYAWVKRGTVRVTCLAQERNAVTQPRLEPEPLDPESTAVTVRPPRLP